MQTLVQDCKGEGEVVFTLNPKPKPNLFKCFLMFTIHVFRPYLKFPQTDRNLELKTFECEES